MATMADVAREAGVSVATVSRLLNNQEIVSPDTASRVYAAIEKLSYEPNLLARNLRRNESRVILILAPNVTNPYYSHILSGIGDVSTQIGYSALIFTTGDDQARVREALDFLKKHRADGAILMASNVGCDWLLGYSTQFPIVQCSEYDPEVEISHISIDNYQAAVDVMEYLHGLGHERIAIISSENEYISTRLRLKGYKDSLLKHDVPMRDEYIIYASRDYSFASGKAKAKELLSVNPRPTAIFCISDTLALGAITAAKEMGLSVPGDLTVIGFDDVVEFTTMFHPYITTVSQPCYELGKQAARLLYAKMSRNIEAPLQTILEHKMVIRESSAGVKKSG